MVDQVQEGLMSPFLQRRRIEVALPYLRGRVLDFGCGSGAMARFFEPKQYVGVDLDELSVSKARKAFPRHTFLSSLQDVAGDFDTVVLLAVIEHVSQPADLLKLLAKRLHNKDSVIVCTTPHPSMDWVHGIGARLGIFSKHATDEHEELLNRSKLSMIGAQAKLRLNHYERFLLGANQLAVFSPL